ncbi:MAG: 2-polyprenylphenol 6-hydroxylase [Gammaproteobacteria bacterium]|nr:2-polyprenylphenol 6-hydroxylase [Gammaproteobacteria bacterium]HJL96079.1 2-polyprenylphenol 6-hydroxylase [SAR86 cluster bacterium]|tara:strand:+ start:2068 stop:3621 length:1554 start_codon:yes stop_codon:yes gene_type:complete
MFKDVLRLLKIIHILLKARLDIELRSIKKPYLLTLLFKISPWKIYSADESTGERLKKALEEAGPIFIKFGQLLSTRPDAISSEVAMNLKSLQDNLPNFSTNQAIDLIEKELEHPIKEVFDDFNKTPIAAASIAQVYSATLKDINKNVAIKVVRPGIKKIINRDLSLMKRISAFIEARSHDAKRLQLSKLVMEYESVILAELNMKVEASNIKQTKRNFENNKLLYVPEAYLDITTENILVMDMIEGIPVDKVEVLKDKGVNLKLLAERGVEIFLKQVFIDNFFHADMHPGNIFINADDPSNPSYVAVDYAIVGSLSEEEQFQIGRMLVAVIARNFGEVANILIEAKWVDESTRQNELENTIRAACEPVFDQPLEKINFGEMLLFIFDSARKFNLSMQPSLMLLQKTLINIEGLGKQLYPKLDFWSIANPFLKNWISERYDPRKISEWAKQNSLNWIEKARKLPEVAETAVQQISNIEMYQKGNEERHQELMNKLSKENRANNLLIAILIVLAAVFLLS